MRNWINENINYIARFSLFCLLAIGLSQVQANDAYHIDKPGDWIVQSASPEPNANTRTLARKGSYYRLYDRQINAIDPQNRSEYKAIEIELTNQTGVRKRSQVQIKLDTSYEHLVLHELGVIRNGIYIDKIPTTKFDQLRSENELNSYIYNGETTVSAILSDIRVGDVVRYSYTLEGSNPVYSDLIEYGQALKYYINIESIAFKLHVAANSPTYVRKHHTGSDFQLKESETNGIRTYQWETNGVKAMSYEDDEPVWTELDPYFAVSSVENWSDVVNWMLPHYNKPNTENKELVDIANKINRRYGNTKAKIGAALQWVQNEIRYFGIELGENSHNPSPAELTLSRRYGDCKDKTVLLIALLDELGIQAEPALVNTKQRLRNPDYIYRLHAFNHVIVHLEHEGRSHWIDPTLDSQKGDLGHFYEPDYGKALIIANGQSDLTSMSNTNNLSSLHVSKRLEIDKAEHDKASLTVRTKRRLSTAEYYRRRITDYGEASLMEDYVDYYRGYYNRLDSAKPLSYREYPQNNTLSTEKYKISDLWTEDDDGALYFEFYADETRNYLNLPDAPNYRTRDYEIEHPVEIAEVNVIQIANVSGEKYASETINNEYFTLTVEVIQDAEENTVTFKHNYTTHGSAVRPEYMKTIKQDIERAWEITYFDLYPHGLGWTEPSNVNASADLDSI